MAFTEHGAIMAATILNSSRAEQMSVYVVRAFVKMRESVASHTALARELATKSIAVNALAPLAATPMTETIRTNEKFAANMMNRIPMKRWADPEEVAGAFVFMASDAASYITGQVLPVDGGMVM